jgi:L-threonylcarbamoyladenylate synthase
MTWWATLLLHGAHVNDGDGTMTALHAATPFNKPDTGQMPTSLVTDISPSALRRAVAVLRRGGLVCHPTDTVYGVAASALLPAAVERLYVVKERPRDRAIPLLLGDGNDVERIARDIPPLAYTLIERFWPGGLTIVLWAQAHVPAIVTAGTGSVALRLPDHAVPRALARALGTA